MSGSSVVALLEGPLPDLRGAWSSRPELHLVAASASLLLKPLQTRLRGVFGGNACRKACLRPCWHRPFQHLPLTASVSLRAQAMSSSVTCQESCLLCVLGWSCQGHSPPTTGGQGRVVIRKLHRVDPGRLTSACHSGSWALLPPKCSCSAPFA